MTFTFDKELELEKLNTAKDTVMKYFDVVYSLIFGTFIAFTAVFMTVLLDKKEPTGVATGVMLFTIVITLAAMLSFLYLVRLNKKFLRQYDKWLEKIRNKEILPLTIEMVEYGDAPIIKQLRKAIHKRRDHPNNQSNQNQDNQTVKTNNS